jgi:hypothetical protein
MSNAVLLVVFFCFLRFAAAGRNLGSDSLLPSSEALAPVSGVDKSVASVAALVPPPASTAAPPPPSRTPRTICAPGAVNSNSTTCLILSTSGQIFSTVAGVLAGFFMVFCFCVVYVHVYNLRRRQHSSEEVPASELMEVVAVNGDGSVHIKGKGATPAILVSIPGDNLPAYMAWKSSGLGQPGDSVHGSVHGSERSDLEEHP